MKNLFLTLLAMLSAFASFAVLPITGTPVTCIGGTISLSDATPGGTWSSSNTSIATIGSLSGICSGISGGTAIISYTVSSVSSITTVTVMPVPLGITGLTTICMGSTTTLVDGSPGGVWSSGNTSVATIGTGGVVTGVSAGTSVISYSIGTGCVVTTVMTIMLTPAPITGTTNLCQGSTSCLTDITPGGYWSTSDPTVATVGSATGCVYGVGPVTAIISYTLPSYWYCNARTTVTVNPIPGPIAGTPNVCVGFTTGLSDALSGGTWTSSNPAIGTVGLTTGVVSGISPGIFICTYSITSTGCLATAAITVNPNPTAIIGTKSVCVGTSTSLTDALTGGTWSSLTGSVAGFLSGPSIGTATGIAAGTETISYILGTGCYVTKTLTVNPVAAVSGGKICPGGTITLTASGGGTWSTSSTTIATIGLTTGIVLGLTSGPVLITYILPTGCTSYATVTVNPLPTTITGPTGVCIGSTITLSDGSVGGIWSSSNSTVASILGVGGSGVVTGHVAGSATITYTIFSTGCLITRSVTVGSPSTITGPGALCVGATIVLSDATTGGTWSSSNTSVATIGTGTGLVTGMSAGTAKITYSISGGCAAYFTVTISPLPGPISGPSSVCSGGTGVFSDAVAGGTWSSYTPSVADFLSGPLSGTLTGISAGTTTISYSVATGCTVFKTITVYATPSSITGTVVACAGATTSLSDATTGGAWSSNNTSVATIGPGTGIVTGISTGTAIISYTTGSSCFTFTTVTINPLPTPILGATDACVGVTTTLSDAGGGVWSIGSSAIATVGLTTGDVTGVSSGTAIITYTLGTGCYATITFTVDPLPATAGTITGADSVCVGSTISLTDAISGGTWICTNTSAIVTSYGVLVGVSTGMDTVIYTVSNSCGSVNTILPVTILPLTYCYAYINQLSKSTNTTLEVYPNPNEGAFTIEILSSADADVKVLISNIIGEKVKELTIKTNKIIDIQLNQPVGVYFISATTANGKSMEKIIVR